MDVDPSLPFRAALDAYQQKAETLFGALTSGDEAAVWRAKWEHPRFAGQSAADVRAATLDLADAQLVVAREYGFEDWANLAAFTDAVHRDDAVALFETAADAVISGDVTTLQAMLRAHPALARARSARRHHATLLHYVAANGVERGRQKTPANAVAVATILLEAGADPNALADMYDGKCTPMSMLVSSVHPYEAGLQPALACTLIDHGAALEGAGSKSPSALMTALASGYLDTAEALADRGAPVDSLAAAAGLGRVDQAARLLEGAGQDSRHLSLALAARHGHTEVVRLLLDAGEDPNRYNPEGCHAHSTPLHQAVWSNHEDVVRLLVERGARLDLRDTVHDGTPLDWAIHGDRVTIANYLRAVG